MNAVEPDRITRKEYPTYGECIYCGARAGDVDLTDEHIVPYSLGGNAFIRDGSCKACAAETTKCERELAKVVLGDFRNSIGEQTRRPKKRAKVGSFVASINCGPRQTFTVPIADLPLFHAHASLGLARNDAGRTRRRGSSKRQRLTYTTGCRQTSGKPSSWVRSTLLNFRSLSSSSTTTRWRGPLQKSATATQSCVGDCVGFDRLDLPERIILGRYPMVPYYVGCPLIEPDSPQEREVKHAVWLSEVDQAGKKFYLAELRLFGNSSGTADHGMPVYYVVWVGAPVCLQMTLCAGTTSIFV